MSNSIRVRVLGAVHMKGISDKGKGQPYDFATVSYTVEADSMTNDYMARTVVGCDVQQASASGKDLVLKMASLSFPVELDLVLSPDPKNIQRNIVTDFSVSEPPKVHDPLKKFSV